LVAVARWALPRRRRRHVAAGHLHQLEVLAIQPQRGQLAAPDRAGVDGVYAVADEQAERAPVAADDLQVARRMAGDREPGVQAGWLGARRALVFERDAP